MSTAAETTMRTLFRISRWLHKYVGLVLILFCIWMGISGIVLNHPHLVKDLAVPGWAVPPQYRVRDWSRGTLRQVVFSPSDPQRAYVGGILGVWTTADGGQSFEPLSDGFPASFVERQVSGLVLARTAAGELLFAGTRGGLYVCRLPAGHWRRLALPREAETPWEHRAIKALVRVDGYLLVFTDSRVFRGPLDTLEFHDVTPRREPAEPLKVSLVRLFFDVHCGKVWGLAGRLVYDAAGLLIVFLSVSAFYIWYRPWRTRRSAKNGQATPTAASRLVRWFLKYHLKVGIWAALVLLLIGGTAVFMRPPLIALLADGSLPADLYPGPLSRNPWDQRIINAVYDEPRGRLLIETNDDGFWEGPPDFSGPFRRSNFRPPLFVMGSTVLRAEDDGLLVGSFAGLFKVNPDGRDPIDMLTGRPARDVSRFRPAEVMVTGYLRLPDGSTFVAQHRGGLLPLHDSTRAGRFQMPPQAAREFRLPLWNLMFELHNARIFQDLIGAFYALIAPLGSLLFVLITLTGVYDWCYLKLVAARNSEN